MPTSTTELLPIERAVLTAISEAASAEAEILRAQLPTLTVTRRERSPVGFFTHFVGDAKDVPGAPERSWIGDVGARVPGVASGVGFVVLIERGRVTMLEGYTFGDDVLPDDLTTFELW